MSVRKHLAVFGVKSIAKLAFCVITSQELIDEVLGSTSDCVALDFDNTGEPTSLKDWVLHFVPTDLFLRNCVAYNVCNVTYDKIPAGRKLSTRADIREAWSKSKAHMLGEEKVIAEPPN